MDRRKYYDTTGESNLKDLIIEQKKIFTNENHSHIIDTTFRIILIQCNKCNYEEALQDIEKLMEILEKRGWGSREVIVGKFWKKEKRFENIEAITFKVHYIKWWQISIYKAACLIGLENFDKAHEILENRSQNLFELVTYLILIIFPNLLFFKTKVLHLLGGIYNLDKAIEILTILRNAFTSINLSNTTRLLFSEISALGTCF